MSGLADEVLELRMASESVPAYLFDIMLRGSGARVGQVLLRLDREDPGLVGFAGHIGVEIAAEHRGHGHGSRAVRLLGPLARAHGFSELWLTTGPDNAASRRALERLGAQYVDTVAVPAGSDMHALGIHAVRRYRWTLTADPELAP